MLDTHARKYVSPIIEGGADFFIKLKLTANNVTQLALLFGLLTAILIYFDKPILAVVILWLSGYLDAVDGSIARKTKTSSNFGTLMDITFDRIVEISMIIAIGLKFNDARFNLIILLSCILISMVIFLTVGALTEKSGMKSFYYQAGVAERSEGFIMFSLMILLPMYLNVIINIFSLMIIFTAGQRAMEAKKILK